MKLEEKTLERPFPFFFADGIGAESLLEMFDLELIKAFFRIAVEEINDFFCRQVVPVFTD